MKLVANNKSLNNRANLSDDDSTDSCIFGPPVFRRVFVTGNSPKFSNPGWNTKSLPITIIKRTQPPLTCATSSKKIKSAGGRSTAIAERKPSPPSYMKGNSKSVPNRELFSPLPSSLKGNSKPKSLVVSSNRGVSSLKPVAGRTAPPPLFMKSNSKLGSAPKKLNVPLMDHRAGLTKKDNSVSAVIDMWLKQRLQKKGRLELKLEHLNKEISSLKRQMAKTKKSGIESSDSASDSGSGIDNM